jgi:hypothetical protein
MSVPAPSVNGIFSACRHAVRCCNVVSQQLLMGKGWQGNENGIFLDRNGVLPYWRIFNSDNTASVVHVFTMILNETWRNCVEMRYFN